ncbi:hypothetical protein [Allorhodopirellula heiligendammensis]|uniref:Uncharacterized protein n=1 Tax=Allorhodopirellula heiligendammensis TaxID=2714739 RepID=A0A5C6AZ75_9BACT|nr:hypothetical protein [Allorhodopirellula heiligendammensis]TWU05335.1 hypothetical protein Poly21_57560 [Allorhodopirellula heiligendammensis]
MPQLLQVVPVLTGIALLLGCNPQSDMTPKQIVEQPNKFHYSERDYKVASAGIAAYVGDPRWHDPKTEINGKQMQWTMGIEALPDPEDDLGPPSISFDGLDIAVDDWREIEGFSQSWEDWKNPRTGDRFAMTYHSGHDSVSRCRIEIVARYGNLFRVVAEGGEPWTSPFTFDATFTFNGVGIMADPNATEADVRRIIKREFPESSFELSSLDRDTEFVHAKFDLPDHDGG